jgi:hypothetical protein
MNGEDKQYKDLTEEQKGAYKQAMLVNAENRRRYLASKEQYEANVLKLKGDYENALARSESVYKEKLDQYQMTMHMVRNAFLQALPKEKGFLKGSITDLVPYEIWRRFGLVHPHIER